MADPKQERLLQQRRALGRSLACDPILPGVDLGRDLALAYGPDGLDLGGVEGAANLAQALEIALTTLLGVDIFNTAFGFDGLNALVTETNPVLLRERVRIAVIQVLRRDPRVRRIVDVKLADGQLEFPSPGSRRLDVRVVFETVTGESAAIDLGRVAPNA